MNPQSILGIDFGKQNSGKTAIAYLFVEQSTK